MALLEIDEVVVDSVIWKAAKSGDPAAKNALRVKLNGLQLYMHNFAPLESIEEIVTLRDLNAADIIESVVVSVEI